MTNTSTGDLSKPFSIIIKWQKEEILIDSDSISEQDTVSHLKNLIYNKTGVLSERQKLLGLKLKGKPADDNVKLSEFKLKPNTKIIMMGSREDDISNLAKPSTSESDVINDFDIPDECEIPIRERQEFLAKIERRVKEYTINVFNEPREGTKLLVLDIDYTLFGKSYKFDPLEARKILTLVSLTLYRSSVNSGTCFSIDETLSSRIFNLRLRAL